MGEPFKKEDSRHLWLTPIALDPAMEEAELAPKINPVSPPGVL